MRSEYPHIYFPKMLTTKEYLAKRKHLLEQGGHTDEQVAENLAYVTNMLTQVKKHVYGIE